MVVVPLRVEHVLVPLHHSGREGVQVKLGSRRLAHDQLAQHVRQRLHHLLGRVHVHAADLPVPGFRG